MADHNDHDGSDGFTGIGGIQTMGILNALKTGDVRVDMAVAMCIPIIFKLLFSGVSNLHQFGQLQRWLVWFFHRRHQHERFITYKSTRDMWGGSTNWDSDTQNTVLIKAIQLYIHHKLDLNIPTAVVDLTSTEDKAASMDGDYDGEGTRSYKTLVDSLSRYKIVKKLPQDKWHNLGCFGGGGKDTDGFYSPAAPVKLRIYHETENVGNDRNTRQYCTLTFHFISPGATAIDAFIDTAYQWYMTQLRALEDNSRYLYELKSLPSASNAGKSADDGDGDNDKSAGSILYTRYKLTDQKTFDSLFFPEKETLLSLVRHFTNKSGKYAIPGYPHKLGLLLHGPPGTGKTSLIKALAHSTGRSIVNVPLARISTNSELMSIFFDKRYHIQGEDVPVTLDFKDVIFVMEDVDSASRIVRGRGRTKTTDSVQAEQVDLPAPKSIWRMLLEGSDDESCQLVDMLLTMSDRLREEATKPDMLRSMTKRMAVLPGLGLVGGTVSNNLDDNISEESSKALRRVGEEALEAANSMLDGYSTIDRFVGTHARVIKRLLDAGADVDDDFVDSLLDPFVACNIGDLSTYPQRVNISNLSRDISYTKQNATSNVMNSATESLLASVALMMDPTQCGNTNGNSAASGGFDLMGPSIPWSKPDKDQLNLSGLLNVLDGVVDTPGRILIMTTNHPEVLDPAIIRPGRIDKRIELGFIRAAEAISMLEHYFQVTLTEDQRLRVERVVHGDGLDHAHVQMTPAQLEQLTAEHDDIESMVQVLETVGRPVNLLLSPQPGNSAFLCSYDSHNET